MWVKDAMVCRRRKLGSHHNAAVGVLDPVEQKLLRFQIGGFLMHFIYLCRYPTNQDM